jgi:hypothetical protein
MSPGGPGQGEALTVLFALEELRRAFGHLATPGADPRHDTAPFRAFRQRLLQAASGCARGEARLTAWWEGTYNGYALAVQADPASAAPALAEAAAAACPVEGSRLAPPRKGGYPLALVRPGSAELERDEGGALVEAPFGASGGHFGAPGVRRIR